MFVFDKCSELNLPKEKRWVTGSCTVLETSLKNSQSNVNCNKETLNNFLNQKRTASIGPVTHFLFLTTSAQISMTHRQYWTYHQETLLKKPI